MKNLKEQLLWKLEYYEMIFRMSKERQIDVPKGTLRVSKSHNRNQYYCYTGDKKRGTYIPRENEELVRRLAQKSYDEKVIRLTEKRVKQIKSLLKSFEEDEIDKIYDCEHPIRQRLIKPVFPTFQQKMNEWKSREYIGKDFREDAPLIMTERGERVRSKSEKIMADYFYRCGIEYKYEYPIYLKGMGTVYPDFTFLSRWTGDEIYWEHNGRMDDPVYAEKAVRKIQAYENNGIFPGERLILTYETERNVLSTGKIKQLTERYLI